MAAGNTLDLFATALSTPRFSKPRMKLFMKRTLSLYSAQRAKLREYLNDKSAELDYALEYFRMQAEAAIGQPCPYCGQSITIPTMSLDHVIPLKRNDQEMPRIVRFGWDNNRLCHRVCNGRKGVLTAAEFAPIYAAVMRLAPEPRKDFLMRLSSVPFRFFDKRPKKFTNQAEEDF